MRVGFFAAVTAAIAAPASALEIEEMAVEPFEQNDDFSLAELGLDEDDFNLAELGLDDDDLDFAELGSDSDFDLAELGSDDDFDYPEFDDEFDLAELGSDDELDLPEMEDDDDFNYEELDEMLAELGFDDLESALSQLNEEEVDGDEELAETGEQGWHHLHLMQHYAHARNVMRKKAKHMTALIHTINN